MPSEDFAFDFQRNNEFQTLRRTENEHLFVHTLGNSREFDSTQQQAFPQLQILRRSYTLPPSPPRARVLLSKNPLGHLWGATAENVVPEHSPLSSSQIQTNVLLGRSEVWRPFQRQSNASSCFFEVFYPDVLHGLENLI